MERTYTLIAAMLCTLAALEAGLAYGLWHSLALRLMAAQ